MTAKEYLTQAYRIDQRINSKLEQVSSLRDLSTKATSTFSDVPPSGTRNVHRMEDVICKIVMLENEINALQYLVTGIGVNVNQRPEDFSPDVRPIAASLFNVLGRPVRRSELAVQIIRALDRMYSAFPQGKADYLARYRADCLTPGNRVQLITPASRTEATALSIDDEFRLVVEYDDGRREALSAGEVSVRGMYGYV